MLKLGRILGIEVSLHWTLFLLLGAYAIAAPVGGMLASVAFISAVFSCVLFHEFGHSLAARQFGIETNSIVLYPIGGVATLERMPRDPKQELWVAIAGPLVNVVIASLLFLEQLAHWYVPGHALIVGPELHGWLTYLMITNMGLVAFNMLPAFPMDGGRVFRALAAMVMPYVRATNLAASVGKVVAIGLALLGFWMGYVMFIVIAGFVFFVGSAEARAVAADFAARPTHSVGSGRVFRTLRNGRDILVVWDDAIQAYRYAT